MYTANLNGIGTQFQGGVGGVGTESSFSLIQFSAQRDSMGKKGSNETGGGVYQ